MTERKRYEKPVITPLHAIRNSKVGVSRSRQRIRRCIEGVPVRELVERYGSPLYVFSERRMRSKVQELRNAFESRYPSVQLAWSYKTNYLDALCSIFHQEGCLAEVVSEMEYCKARRLGVPGNRVIVNGPLKTLAALERAVAEEACIHIDHFDELQDLVSLGGDKLLPVGIRVNLDAGIHPRWSRFGFNLENGEAARAAEIIAHTPHLTLNGIHCHIGTYIVDPSAYAVQAEKMARFLAEVEAEWDFQIAYLDLGGGLPSRSRLKGAAVSPHVGLPAVDEYAEEICTSLLSHLPEGRRPVLILEAGRFLIDEAGFLLTSVVARKRDPEGRPGYILDAGLHNLFTSFWYRYRIECESPGMGPLEPSSLYGSLCMNIDVIEPDIMLPALDRGSILTVSPVGAYNNTQSMQFIHARPATVLIRSDAGVDVIREAEDLGDIVGRERNPFDAAAPQAATPPTTERLR